MILFRATVWSIALFLLLPRRSQFNLAVMTAGAPAGGYAQMETFYTSQPAWSEANETFAISVESDGFLAPTYAAFIKESDAPAFNPAPPSATPNSCITTAINDQCAYDIKCSAATDPCAVLLESAAPPSVGMQSQQHFLFSAAFLIALVIFFNH